MKTRTKRLLARLPLMAGASILAAAANDPMDTNPVDLASAATADARQTPASAPTEGTPTSGVSSDPRTAPPPVRLSSGLSAVVKLVRKGVATEVVIAYIDASPAVYHLTASDLLQFHQLGVPAEVTSALIRHGEKMREQLAKSSTAVFPNAAQPAPFSPVPVVYTQPAYVQPRVPCLQPADPYALYPRSRYTCPPPRYFGPYRSAFASTLVPRPSRFGAQGVFAYGRVGQPTHRFPTRGRWEPGP
jgi:hypothetical protein